MNAEIKVPKHGLKIYNGLRSSFSTKKRAFTSLFFSFVIFVGLTLSARPIFAYQMISSNPLLLLTAVELSFLYNSPNAFSMALTVIYAVLSGPAIVNIALQLKNFGLGIKNMGAIAPGFIASGCAGCGAGLLGILGFTGALASLPFGGNLITLAGIFLIIVFLARAGDPEVCRL